MLSRRSSYDWRYAKACAPDYGVVLTLRADASMVQVALCFECNILGVHHGTADGGERIGSEVDFDPVAPALRALMREVFPDDAAIAALK